ncbi:putative lipoprotein [Paenibacillus algicola]|uniref:Putative lipoprotein n=1 Tax=Paenibacillus algicola TaxID=2565926 RepID=A0A4P8XEP7_9BACL|nr:hypothetical protein [Paenibacillus algicola]QCT00817.1 putative lipoprotein [Paenibacillus algicola]
MNRKFMSLMLAVLMVMTVVLAGCAKNEEPKAAMTKAAQQAMSMESYEMKSSFIIEDLQMNVGMVEDDPTMTQAMTMLKNAELTLSGVYQAEPQQTEMRMGINLKGDLAMTFNVDMVMTTDMLYVKVPNIPTMPLPEDLVGKYLAIDLKELAEEAGEEFDPAMLDTEKNQKFATEVMNALLSEYDQEKYFKEVAVKDANLPEGVEAKQVVQFFVTNDNIKEAIDTLVNQAAPKILDIAAKEEYRTLLGLTQEDIDIAKEELNNVDQGEFEEAMTEMQQYLKINNFNINTAVNKDDFPVYQDMAMNVEITEPETDESMKIAVKGSTQYSKINEPQTFVVGIPEGDNVVTLDELEQMGW